MYTCPPCNGTGIDEEQEDGVCEWCEGTGELTNDEMWDYYDQDSEKWDAEALAWAESQEGSNTWNIDS